MSMTAVRKELLDDIQASLQAGDTQAALAKIAQARREADPDTLLTTTEAAQLLGIRSVNTVKRWLHSGYLQGVQIDSRTMIPLTEIDRIRDSDRVRTIRVSDRLHDASSEFGDDEGMSDEQMLNLVASRPGKPPWRE